MRRYIGKAIAKIAAEASGFAAYLVWAHLVGHALVADRHWALCLGLLVCNFVAGVIAGWSITRDAFRLRTILRFRRSIADGELIFLGVGDA